MGIQGVMFKGLECGVQALLLQGLLGRTLTASKVGHIFWHPPHARILGTSVQICWNPGSHSL